MKIGTCRLSICLVALSLMASFSSLGLASNDFPNQLDSLQIENHCDVHTYQCYVTIDQIFVSSDGIFVNLENIGVLPIYNLTQIESNLFLVHAGFTCPKHGQYCPLCRGCAPWNRCQYRCKCPPRP